MHTGERLQELFDLLSKHYGPREWWPGDTALEVMVGAVLTQNTNWRNVAKAIDNLRGAGALTLESLLELDMARLAELIRPSGYYRLKAGRLRNLLDMIVARYDGDLSYMFDQTLDTLREDLLGVKGIGPETADSICLYAARKPIFVVDAYTFRILGRHGLADPSMSYFELQATFMDYLDADVDMFNEFHALLVSLGKDYCKKSKPRCDMCPAQVWSTPDLSNG